MTAGVRRLGAYAPLSANYSADDAIMAAGEAAELLFVRALAFCADSDSDGYMTAAQLTRYVGAGMRDAPKRAAKLVEVGLFEAHDGGWSIRSWAKWNKTADEKGRTRKTDRDRKREARGVQTESERSPDGQPAESDSGRKNVPVLIQDKTEQGIATATDKPPRDRDLIWDAVVEACGINDAELTKTGKGPVVAAVRDLKAVGATAAQITLRARKYRERFKDAALTPTALSKHWATLDQITQTGVKPAGWEFG